MLRGSSVIDGDDFIHNLWDIHEKVKAEGYTQVQTLSSESYKYIA